MYHRQLARFGTLKDAVNVKSRTPPYSSMIRAQRHKPAGAGPPRVVRGRRPATSVNQLDDAPKHWERSDECGIGEQEKGIHSGGGHRRECRVDLLRTGVDADQLEPERARGFVQHPRIVTPSRVERVAEQANSGDVRRCPLQILQALLMLVSPIER